MDLKHQIRKEIERDIKRKNRKLIKIQEKNNKILSLENNNKNILNKTHELEKQNNNYKKENNDLNIKLNLLNEEKNILKNENDKLNEKLNKLNLDLELINKKYKSLNDKSNKNIIEKNNFKNNIYILSHFNLKTNTKMKEIKYLTENTDFRLKRHMLCCFNDFDISSIKINSKFMNSIKIKFFDEYHNIFNINIIFNPKKQNFMSIISNGEFIVRTNIDINLMEKYYFEIISINNNIKFYFNDKFYGEIKNIDIKIKYISSNSNFNIIYN